MSGTADAMRPSLQMPSYRPWAKDEPHSWLSLQDFVDAGKHSAGLHVIQTSGCPIELIVHGEESSFEPSGVLPVFFAGAVSGRGDKIPPFFSGLSVARQLGKPCICVADPTLSLAQDLALGWYAGNQWQRLQDELTDVLRHLSDSFGMELLLVGGGGGGFAALNFGMRLDDRASTLVWNPQTDFFKYSRPALDAYLKVAFPDLVDEKGADAVSAQSLAERGVRASVTASEGASGPRRMLYLQNAGDSQARTHTAPFIAGHGLAPVESDLYVAGNGHQAIFFGNWGRGPATPPTDLIKALVWAMCDRDFMPARLFESPASEQVIAVRKPEKAPFNAVWAPVASLGVDVVPAHGGIVVSAAPAVDADYPGASYAFYAYSRGERVRTRWYTTSRQAYFRAEGHQPVDRIVAFMRDGLDQLAATAELAFKALEDDGKRIFIFGSCVSRDAFVGDMKPYDYLARSSIASAFGHPCDVGLAEADLGGITSEFQRRMVAADLRRSAVTALASTEYDYLLLDLIDERFELAEFGNCFITVSSELLRSGIQLPPRAERVSPTDPRRMKCWREGFRRLVRIVGEERIILNRVFWATHDESGAELPKQAEIQAANIHLARMYGFIDSFEGIRAIDYPAALLVSDSAHKWGISPFHFVPELYLHTLKSITELGWSSPAPAMP
ncbi:DUF6270 domain-containing protein [Pseudoxanthomonas beigongshangi]